MKTLNDYMEMSYRMEIVEDKDEGGFVVTYPDLPGCITCGETIESAVTNALDAKREWITAALESGIEIHEPDTLADYSGQFKLRIPRSLHKSLAEHSQREGMPAAGDEMSCIRRPDTGSRKEKSMSSTHL